jgi:hypothetical protein
MRLEGASWDAIAAALKVSPTEAIMRADRIGMRGLPARPPRREDPAREPLAAGHPLSWGVLTQGTSLAGTRYPLPRQAGGLT